MNARIAITLVGMLSSTAAFPQAQPATAAAPVAAPASQPISQGLGVMVYPAKGQASSKQAVDENECYNWAKGQTGIDPKPAPAAPTAQAAQQPSTGQRAAGGAAKGAVAGVAIGAVAGDAGKGAAIGATAGALGGHHKAKNAQQQQQAQAQQAQQAHAKEVAAHDASMSTFKKAFGVCMQGRDYTVSN